MKSKLTIIWLLCYISIASVSAAIITPALPQIEQAFSLSTGTVEWMVSSFLVGCVVGQLLYGPLANSFGRLKALRLGLYINLLGLSLCIVAGFVHHYPLLLIGRLITGLGSAAGLPCTFMLINEWLPEEQRKATMAYSILSFALGISLAVLVGGIMTQYIAWQACFAILTLQGIVMLIGLRIFDETLIYSKPLHIHTLLLDYGQALHSSKLLIFSLCWSACTAFAYCYSAAAPQIAQGHLHLSSSEYGYWNTVTVGGMLLGGLSARWLMQRLSVMQVIGLGYLGSFIGLLALFAHYQMQSTSVPGFFMSASLLYCCTSYLFAGGSYVASNAIADKASASSMMSFVNMGGATLSVVVMGYLSSNPFTAFLALLALVFSITLGMLILFHYKKGTGLSQK